ncbi:hypothetical protein BJY54_006924 [Streptomyces nodosus]|nr:hypothetical protein [Streptomyces nodosus]
MHETPGPASWIGVLHTPRPVGLKSLATNLTPKTSVTDQQLRGLEKTRTGNDLPLRAELSLTALAETTHWPVADDQQIIRVPHTTWSNALTQLDAGAFVDVLIPVTTVDARATGARRIREAKTAIRCPRPSGPRSRTRGLQYPEGPRPGGAEESRGTGPGGALGDAHLERLRAVQRRTARRLRHHRELHLDPRRRHRGRRHRRQPARPAGRPAVVPQDARGSSPATLAVRAASIPAPMAFSAALPLWSPTRAARRCRCTCCPLASASSASWVFRRSSSSSSTSSRCLSTLVSACSTGRTLLRDAVLLVCVVLGALLGTWAV